MSADKEKNFSPELAWFYFKGSLALARCLFWIYGFE